jgi:EpsI family protein
MSRVAWLFLIMMLAGAGLSERLKPTALAAPLSSAELNGFVPDAFGEWRQAESLNSPLPDVELQAQINRVYDGVLQKVYVRADGVRVMLLLAYNRQQMGLARAHRQELCYQSSGAEVLNQEYVDIALPRGALTVMRMHTVNGARQEPLTYWFTVGNRAAVAPGDLLMAQVMAGLTGQAPDGFLVRVSSISTHPRQAHAIQAEFIQTMLGAMPPQRALRLSGGGES